MENKVEIWKSIKEFDDYEVSNLGNVRSLKKSVVKNLKPGINSVGYKIVVLCVNGKVKTFNVHQLVAIAFLNHKLCGLKFVINHIDFNKLNNHVDNLEIVTNRENSNRKHIKSSSEFVGVSWSKIHSKWVSNIRINGKLKYLGLFIVEKEASDAYQIQLNKL